MSVQIKLFGPLAEVAGKDTVQLPGAADTDSLRRDMLEKYPQLAGLTFVIAVRKQIVKGNVIISNEDEVALLPPFAGG